MADMAKREQEEYALSLKPGDIATVYYGDSRLDGIPQWRDERVVRVTKTRIVTEVGPYRRVGHIGYTYGKRRVRGTIRPYTIEEAERVHLARMRAERRAAIKTLINALERNEITTAQQDELLATYARMTDDTPNT